MYIYTPKRKLCDPLSPNFEHSYEESIDEAGHCICSPSQAAPEDRKTTDPYI